MQRMIARAIAAQEEREYNCFVVVLAENVDGTGARLELQRALSFDEQDRALGMATYCLCTESGATHYGGVESWSLTNGRLMIRLDAAAADELDVKDGFVIELVADEQTLAALESGVRRVLEECRP